jgi:hypothetical protein
VTLQLISTFLAAFAAIFAAISSWTSLKSTRAVEDDVRLARSQARHDLFRSFEADLARQYEGLWVCLGPWDDGLAPEAKPSDRERRVVHELLQTLSSVHLAGKLELLEDEQRRYAEILFLEWLSTPRAREIWELVFRDQVASWPQGFPAWVDSELDRLQGLALPREST